MHIAAASAAAEAWLGLVDAGEYEKSWEAAAPLFRQQITAEQWRQASEQVRLPLGTMRSRTLSAAEYSTSLPNAPVGEYVVLDFTSAFSELPRAVEKLVLMKGSDGEWEAIGYFVRPAR